MVTKMIPKKRQLSDLKPGEQSVTDINKVRMKKVLDRVIANRPNVIFAYEEDQIAKGNTNYEPGKPYPFTDNA